MLSSRFRVTARQFTKQNKRSWKLVRFQEKGTTNNYQFIGVLQSGSNAIGKFYFWNTQLKIFLDVTSSANSFFGNE
jgi:hypothetical protein